MKLLVEEQYSHTIQGEGAYAGMYCDFIRLYGCPVGCSFCDQGYADGGKNNTFAVKELDDIINDLTTDSVVITGGEPLVHRHIGKLISVLADNHRKIHIETSGIAHVRELDEYCGKTWVTLSPKQHLNSKAVVDERMWNLADEIKLIISERQDFDYYLPYIDSSQVCEPEIYLQPEWNNREKAIPIILDILKEYPDFLMSLQTHKYINLP